MRYRGQSYEIETVLTHEEIAEGRIAAMAEAFHQAHERIYDHCDRAAPIQVINLRLVIVGASPKPEFPKRTPVGGRAKPAREIEVYLDGRHTRIPLYLREHGDRADLRRSGGRGAGGLHHVHPGWLFR